MTIKDYIKFQPEVEVEKPKPSKKDKEVEADNGDLSE